MIVEYDRYTYAQRLFEERRFVDAARELEGVIEAAESAAADGEGMSGLGEARLLLARAYYHSAQLGHAEAAARALVDADPTDTYAMTLLARTLDRRGHADEADRWRRRAEALDG